MAKNLTSNAHFEVFLSRRCQNVEDVHATFISMKTSFWKRTFLDHGVQNVPQVSSVTSQPRLVQNKLSSLKRPKENQFELLERQFHRGKLSFVNKKGNWAFFLTFFFHLSFIGVFSIWKCKTIVLKTTTWWKRANHFVDEWHQIRCQIPTPYVVDHLTFVWEGVWVIFFLSIIYVMSDISFSAGYYFCQLYPCKLFPLEISLRDTFFWNHP